MKKFLSVFIACVLALAVIAAGTASWRFYEEEINWLSLTLNGSREIYVEYGQEYQELGGQALFTAEETVTEVPVQIKGQVDTAHLGNYLLKYSAQAEGLISTDYRKVYVVDTQKPVITLTINPDSYTLPGHPYEEEGYQATDNHDGDITNKVIRKEADGIVTYTVTDSSGNSFSVERAINYFDPGRPDIQLLGYPVMLIAQNDLYIEAGFTATDKNDGDVTERVVVEGTVNTAVSGIYTLQYTVTNSYGFSATAERTVYVLPQELLPEKLDVSRAPDEPIVPPVTENPEIPEKPELPEYPENCVIPQGGMSYQPNNRVIYLTFDDGPSQHTERLLDILGKYQVKASFFVVQSSKIGIIARTAQEGHTVAIHAYTHNYGKIYASDAAFLADLQAMQELITQHTGHATMLTRFPGGSSNTISRDYNKGIMSRLTKTLTEMGYTYFDWNVDSDDAGRARSAEEVFENITKGALYYKNSVVLQHDTKGYSIDAIERLIVWGLVNGYTFQPLTAESPTCHHPVLN